MRRDERARGEMRRRGGGRAVGATVGRAQVHVDLAARVGREGAAGHERAAGQFAAQVRRRAGDPREHAARAVQAGERAEQPAGVGMGGAAAQLVGRRGLDDLPGVHDHHPVGDLQQQRQVVGDEEDREAQPLLELEDLAQDLALDHDVQPRGGLVHDHDLGLDGQGHRDHHPLAHAAGELVRVAAHTRGRDPDEVEHLDGPGAQLLLGCGRVGAQRVEQLLADPQHRIERVHRALEDDGDLAPAQRAQLRRGGAQHVEAAAGDAPAVIGDAAAGDDGGRAQEADRAVGERRLATATLAGEADDAAGVQRQVHPAHRAGISGGRAVGDREAADVEQRLARRARGRGSARP